MEEYGVKAVNIESQPLVSVVTPVYNMGSFLAECIESVLRQTYKNFEYIIVNNCSTDNTLEVAKAYAEKDDCIKVYDEKEFVGVIENHNRAFRLIAPTSKYCKVVSADDWIFPHCLEQLVGLAEANPSVGIVGSYQLSGSYIKWQGFEYPKAVLPGHEICRQIFTAGDPSFGFGSPTSLLYRADIVRNSGGFYPNSSPHSDTSACFQHLQNCDFGFVYQVLSYERIHNETQSSQSATIDRYTSAYLNDLIQYGPLYLGEKELQRKLTEKLMGYHQYLAARLLQFKGKKFWDYHKGRLEELGHPLKFPTLLKALIVKVLRELMNPEQAFRKFKGLYFPK